MGYMRHNAIVVTGWQEESLKLARDKALELFNVTGIMQKERYLAEVTEITPLSVNSYRTFVVAPDGSKEGWGQSDHGDRVRATFIQWMRDQYHEGHYYDFVEVSYGEDDYKPARIVADSNDKEPEDE